MTAPSFADLAAKLAEPAAPATAAPNLDSSMRFALDDLTDHTRRIADARAVAAAKAAAVVSAHRAIEAAYASLGQGVDPSLYTVEDDAWELADQVPADIEAHRQEVLAAAEEEDPDGEDRDARAEIDAAHDLALELHALLAGLRKVEPDLEGYELRELVDQADTIEGAKQAEVRTLARFDAAAELRHRVDAYSKALHDYLARWPDEEREDEAERVRELVFGE